MRHPYISFLGFVSICVFVFSAVGAASKGTFTLNVVPPDVTFKQAECYDRVKLPDCGSQTGPMERSVRII
jgi:hypothetical protein